MTRVRRRPATASVRGCGRCAWSAAPRWPSWRESTGISVSTLSRLESGQRRPTLELLLPLARAHQVPLDELVDAPETGDPRVRAQAGRAARAHLPAADPAPRRAAGVQDDRPGDARRGAADRGTHEGYEWLYVLSGRLRLRARRPRPGARRRARWSSSTPARRTGSATPGRSRSRCSRCSGRRASGCTCADPAGAPDRRGLVPNPAPGSPNRAVWYQTPPPSPAPIRPETVHPGGAPSYPRSVAGGRERVGVVGGGIVGLAVARRLLETRPGAEVTVFEKETAVGRHQTGRNSGVVHAGLYYPPGSLKARAVPARRRAAARVLRGARDRLRRVRQGGRRARPPRRRRACARSRSARRANGVPGVRRLAPAELREHRAARRGVAGAALAHDRDRRLPRRRPGARRRRRARRRRGAARHRGRRGSSRDGRVVRVDAGGERHERATASSSAPGCSATGSAALAGDDADPGIVPFRGEYYRLRAERAHLVRGLVYPVPDPRYPFLGVHLTRRVDGEVDGRPERRARLAREGYRRARRACCATSPSIAGARRLPARCARQHWRTGVARDARLAAPPRVRRRGPPLRARADRRRRRAGPRGVRAQAVDRDGTLVDDFRISRLGRVTSVRNAPSPAATSRLAIAEHVVEGLLA